MHANRSLLLRIGLVFSVLILSMSANAQSIDPARRKLAIDLAQEGRCEVALVELAAVAEALPDDALIWQLIGECQLHLRQFRQAATSLENARRLDADVPAVNLHLAMSYFHQGELEAANQALARSEAVDSDRPEFLLYAGMIALARQDPGTAIGRLDAASRLDQGAVEPMASFYLGRAYAGSRDRERALDAFERVIREAPETVWAEEAERAIGTLDEEDSVKVWGALEIGFEHDDNALLRGRGVRQPDEISGQSDQRGFWFLDAGALLVMNDDWSGGIALRYGGSEHHELDRFDAHAPGGTIWLDRALGIADASLRLQADFDATWIDGDPFVLSHLWTGSIYKPWETGAYTILSTSVGLDDYRYDTTPVRDGPGMTGGPCPVGVLLCGPAGLDEKNGRDRDGRQVNVSLLHRELIPIESEWLARPWIEGQYVYSHYKSKGTEYDHERHQIGIGIGVELPLEVRLSVLGRYAYLPYANASTFPDPSDIQPGLQYFLNNSARREHETLVRVGLERAFGEHVVVSTRWTRTRNHSNADVFDYTRDLFGLSVRIGLGG